MNHCKLCGNNIPDNVYDCEMAGYTCQSPTTPYNKTLEECVKEFESIDWSVTSEEDARLFLTIFAEKIRKEILNELIEYYNYYGNEDELIQVPTLVKQLKGYLLIPPNP